MQRVADVPSEFVENPPWEVPEQMSTFKRTARMRVGGRGYGGPNGIGLPTQPHLLHRHKSG
ncbi:hypothetical protein U9M48_000542 [Paspalum notatum var. saurae]|uniref:Uncharacterized protein n=1 Tax=Paspalum notatum var. saurae TaxID=547442 RepID=A0AAQ3PE35_PASNO